MKIFRKRSRHQNADSKYSDLGYVRQIRHQLRLIGAWPDPKGRRHLFLLVIWIFITMSSITYLKINIGTMDFFELGQIYNSIFMFIHNTICLLMPQLGGGDVIKSFVSKINLYHFRNKSEYAAKVHAKINKISTYLTKSTCYQMYMGVILFSVTPIYDNYKSGVFGKFAQNVTYQHSLDMQLPFEMNTPQAYVSILVFNVFITYICSVCFCVSGLLICVIMIHIYGHLMILKHDIDCCRKRLSESSFKNWRFTVSENEQFFIQLKENIKYYKLIMDFLSKSSKKFSYVVCAYFAFQLLSGCLLLLQLSTMDVAVIGKFAPVTIVLIQQLVQISVSFELVAAGSAKLSDAVYNMPWECVDGRNQKTLLFFLMMTQNPPQLKVAGMVSVGVKTMGSNFKSCLSYFLILRTFVKE